VSPRGKSLVRLSALAIACLPALAAVHPVPKDRTALANHDWLPHVVSKIAPLEWWSVASSPSDLRRDDFSSDYEYEQAKLDTSFPRFCFSLFRPKPEVMSLLTTAVNDYQGDVIWVMGEGCIYAMPFKATFITSETGFVNRAMLDAPRLSTYLEERLGLAGKPSLDFDPRWLTREGLASSRGQFEEFWEPGSWTVFLALKPQEYARTAHPTSTTDRPLAMGIAAYELDAMFDPLDAGWESRPGDGTAGPVIPAYPLLSRISDLTADALYERQEVSALLDECLQMQANTSNPVAIRGLDNLIRIARWAQKLKSGIYFGAQNP
jgi:hypothetical protein